MIICIWWLTTTWRFLPVDMGYSRQSERFEGHRYFYYIDWWANHSWFAYSSYRLVWLPQVIGWCIFPFKYRCRWYNLNTPHVLFQFQWYLPCITTYGYWCDSIENSRSDLKLLEAFDRYSYTNEIGPGIYDIHPPWVPFVDEMYQWTIALFRCLPADLFWINSDFNLKTCDWAEVKAALTNLVAVTHKLHIEKH
jgi:hypothetical protein